MLYLHTRATNTNSLVMLYLHTRATNRKKESLSLQLSSYEPYNDKRQNDQKFLAIQPQRPLRVVFLFIDQLLLTTESKQLDTTLSTHPQEPIVSHRGHPTDVK